MLRKIIRISEEKCNGCGACAAACHEGAIEMVNGKAVLTREDYCDGLGDCLPACPADAITFEVREAPSYNAAAVAAAKQAQNAGPAPHGCPGARAKAIIHDKPASLETGSLSVSSRLSQWPVQIKLLPVHAPYFENASLLVAADCTAYAYGNFHEDFIRDHVVLIGCPKLDDVNYADKLVQIFSENQISDVTVVRMEVPCCGGIDFAVRTAIQASHKNIPCRTVTISVDGDILSSRE